MQFELCKLKVPVNAPLCAHPQMGTPVSNARDLLRALISEPTVAGWQWLVALLQEQIPPLPPKPQPPFPGAARGHSRQELERLAGLLQLKVDINTVGNGPANAQTVTVKISLRDLAPEFPERTRTIECVFHPVEGRGYKYKRAEALACEAVASELRLYTPPRQATRQEKDWIDLGAVFASLMPVHLFSDPPSTFLKGSVASFDYEGCGYPLAICATATGVAIDRATRPWVRNAEMSDAFEQITWGEPEQARFGRQLDLQERVAGPKNLPGAFTVAFRHFAPPSASSVSFVKYGRYAPKENLHMRTDWAAVAKAGSLTHEQKMYCVADGVAPLLVRSFLSLLEPSPRRAPAVDACAAREEEATA